MAVYVASNENRFYGAVEQDYGTVPAITSANRFPAVSLGAKEQLDKLQRRDKTGSRTFTGTPAGVRRKTTFEVKTYLTSWLNQTQEPSCGPLFQSALGGDPRVFGGGIVEALVGSNGIQFVAPHGLGVGQGVTFGGEIRFVSGVVDAQTIEVNVPFTLQPTAGSPIGTTVSYQPAKRPKSVSLFDYWGPESAVQRVINGAAVDKMRISVNGDFHEFEFTGPAAELVDSVSFETGQGELTAYPAEPALADFGYIPIPGHLGQAWLGVIPEQFFTITSAEFVLDNDLDARNREFGSMKQRAVTGGVRTASLSFSLYEQDDATTQSLYQAAKQRSPISVMFQLGQQSGQLFGVYMKSLQVETPEFDDRENRLQWKFVNCRAQGTIDDELFVAFG